MWRIGEDPMERRKLREIRRGKMNSILELLPETNSSLLRILEPVTLTTGSVLLEPDQKIEHVYFLVTALVSIVCTNSEGDSVEIGLIGREGMVGLPGFLGGVTPYRAVVQMSGDAFRADAKKLREEFRKNPRLRELLLKYTNAFIVQISQSSICNCYHTLQERLSRWLLVARDATKSDRLALTHDVIAHMLGTRRASVTVAAGLLQRAGLIKYGRGRITIVDPAGLEATSCECYGILRDGLSRVNA